MEELLAAVTSRELTEWQIFDAMHGLPDRRADIAIGTLIALTVNMNRKKGVAAIKAQDIFPWLKPETREMSLHEKFAQATGMPMSPRPPAPAALPSPSVPASVGSAVAPDDDHSDAYRGTRA